MVISPNGKKFAVDVKGLYKKNYWVVKPKNALENLFYVLAFVPDSERNRFFVLSQSEVNQGVRDHTNDVRERRIQQGRSIERLEAMLGLPWDFAGQFEDMWDKLPD